MRKFRNYLLYAIVPIFSTVIAGCGSKTVMPAYNPDPFGAGAYNAPCEIKDTQESWGATGFASGPASQKGSLQLSALKNAQDMVALKIKHAINVEAGTDETSYALNQLQDIERTNRTIIINTVTDVINDASTECLKFSPVDDRGNIECYVGISIPKEDIYNKLIENTKSSQELTDDYKKQRIREYEADRDRIMKK